MLALRRGAAWDQAATGFSVAADRSETEPPCVSHRSVFSFTTIPLNFVASLLKPLRMRCAWVGMPIPIGAMAGAVAGAFYGVEAIPPDWLDALENGEKR